MVVPAVVPFPANPGRGRSETHAVVAGGGAGADAGGEVLYPGGYVPAGDGICGFLPLAGNGDQRQRQAGEYRVGPDATASYRRRGGAGQWRRRDRLYRDLP